jgi:uncharacterized membrane protein YgcG
MNPSKLAVVCGLAAACAVTLEVRAQAPEKPASNLDVTMTLLPEHAKGPEDITRRIALPPPASPDNRGGSRADKDKPDSGDDGANRPADPGAQGRDTADEARERGREFGQDTAEQSRENRENAGRGRDAGTSNAGGNGSSNGGGGGANNGNGKGPGPPASPPGKP